MDKMTEEEFINYIDCNFPYGSESEWKRIVNEGISISTNSAFMILHEICRAPQRLSVDKNELIRMAEYWKRIFSHPLVEVVYPIALNMVKDNTDISCEYAIKCLNVIRKYPNQFNALSIIYFSGNDTENIVDNVYNEITDEWNKLDS